MARIFISHSSANNAEAIALRDWLQSEGWDDVFLDLDPERGIVAGERWERALNEAASRCEAVIFLVTRAWLASRWCLKELNLAHRLNKRLFGVLIEDVPIAEVPPDLSSAWQLVNLASGSDHQLFRALMPDKAEEAHVTFSTSGLTRLKGGLTKAGLDARFFAWPPADEPNRPPYRGLKPLEAEDAGIFFGREAPVIEALDRLRGLAEAAPPRFLVILGASGAGKSSFLRAGLLPRLDRDDRNFLPLPIIRPDRAVLTGETGLVRSLDAAFQAQGSRRARAEVKAAIDGGAQTLLPLLASLAGNARPPSLPDLPASKPPALVLSIDQGEELFLAEGAEEAEKFLSLLRDLLTAATPDIIALVTIRSDSYERLQLAKPLEGVKQDAMSLPPVHQGSYADIIEGPFRRLRDTPRALKIEPALTQTLLTDIATGGAKDALPLLAFTLERLYADYGGDGNLRLAEYEELGRIKGSIEAAVESALGAGAGSRTPQDRAAQLALLRRAFIPWLAGIDPETGNPRRRVARLSEIPEEARPLVQLLVEQRLLATDVAKGTGEVTIEPAHEALLRQWGLLQTWLVEDSAALAALESVKRAARDWETSGKEASWLTHGGGRLEDAERLRLRPDLAGLLGASDWAYLAACRAREAEEKQREEQQRKRELENLRKARENLSSALTALAVVELERRRPVNAAKLALAAWPRPGATDLPMRAVTVVAIRDSLLELHERRRIVTNGAINSVAFSPDGARVLTGSGDKTARLWDAATGKEIRAFEGHTDGVSSVAFSPDGTRVLTGSGDKTARLWDAATGRQIHGFTGHRDGVISVAFSPDGARVLTGSPGNTARLVEVATGYVIHTFKARGVWGWKSARTSPLAWAFSVLFVALVVKIPSVARSLDGKQVLAGSKAARLLDAATESVLSGPVVEEITSVAFSPDGKQVLAGSSDGTARLWDAATGKELRAFKGHEGSVDSVAFSPDGARVLTGSRDKTARLWDAATGQEIRAFKGHEGSVESVAFSSDGKRVLTGSEDKTARLWEASTGKELRTFRGHKGIVSSVAFSPDGARVLTGSRDKTARLWDATGTEELRAFTGHESRVHSVAFSFDRTRVLTGSYNDTACLWDAATGEQIRTFKEPETSIYSVAFSPDGTHVLTGSYNGTALLWDAATGEQIRAFKGHESIVQAVAFSPDGARVLTGLWDKTARLWDAATGQELRVFQGHDGDVRSVAFSSDGARVLTGGGGGARLWDAATGEQIRTFSAYAVSSVAFSPDGARVLIGSGDARLLDAATGKQIRAFKGHTEQVTSVAFSPDGSRVLTGSLDNTARLWDVATGQEIRAFKGHEGWVESVAFSSDGKRVLTGSEDKTARLWDISSIPTGSIFDIACAWLPDHDLSGLGKDYGLDLSSEAPICQKDASGKFTTPLPDPPAE